MWSRNVSITSGPLISLDQFQHTQAYAMYPGVAVFPTVVTITGATTRVFMEWTLQIVPQSMVHVDRIMQAEILRLLQMMSRQYIMSMCRLPMVQIRMILLCRIL